jgi:hypothetical protein
MANVPIVYKEDDRKGMIAALLALLITLFLLFFIKYHEPDPPKVTIPIPITMSEEGIEEFEISNAGGGAPSAVSESVTEPQASPQEQATQEESAVSVPSGSQSSSSTTSTTQTTQQSSPFSGTGSGGTGTSGSGGGFGPDSGPGTGPGEPGSGTAGERIRKNDLMSDPKTPNTSVCEIALKLIIDSNGNVVAVSEIRDKTTTTNQSLINEVKSLVKKEVKYDARPNTANTTVYYTVTVQPG